MRCYHRFQHDISLFQSTENEKDEQLFCNADEELRRLIVQAGEIDKEIDDPLFKAYNEIVDDLATIDVNKITTKNTLGIEATHTVYGDYIEDFINGNKTFDEVLDDYADIYANNISSNKPWTRDDSVLGSENLTKKQRAIIKQKAIDNGLISKIDVKKIDGMRYGFADFESAGVVRETKYLSEEMWKLSDAEQFKRLDEQIGGNVAGYTWHHSEMPGKMELVPTGIHNITTHNGGRTSEMWADAPR